jgi:hypothetical protein
MNTYELKKELKKETVIMAKFFKEMDAKIKKAQDAPEYGKTYNLMEVAKGKTWAASETKEITIKDVAKRVSEYRKKLTIAEIRKMDMFDWYKKMNQIALEELKRENSQCLLGVDKAVCL